MKILIIRDHPEFIEKASKWFSEKWDVPMVAYRESMEVSLIKKEIPQWYIVIENNRIIAGAGIIDNDFHDRVDLSPNLCALYVEKTHRHQRIAPQLIDFIKKDMQVFNVHTLYLVTDHTALYEKYGWHFYTMVNEEDGNQTRLYRIKNNY